MQHCMVQVKYLRFWSCGFSKPVHEAATASLLFCQYLCFKYVLMRHIILLDPCTRWAKSQQQPLAPGVHSASLGVTQPACRSNTFTNSCSVCCLKLLTNNLFIFIFWTFRWCLCPSTPFPGTVYISLVAPPLAWPIIPLDNESSYRSSLLMTNC